uniref:Ubiquitin-like domain-containing protein n=1 Tax=Noctiluca scintillans TaxID=2966 RepID=A0A7S0ZPT9_NOCSC
MAQVHCVFFDPFAMALRVCVKHGKETWTIDFPDGGVTIRDLRVEVERQLSVPVPSQTLLCSGRKWLGLSYPEDLTVLRAAMDSGPKSVKEVDGIKVVNFMLMSPSGIDGRQELEVHEASISEARGLLKTAPADREASRKALLLIDDILTRASQGLDDLKLVGAMRDRRRALLAQIKELEDMVTSRRAAL